MPTLAITRGLPGSGKTTWARQWVADGACRTRVNRDDIRAMFGYPANGIAGQEKAVTIAQHAAIRDLLKRGQHVVVDDMNLRARYVRDLRRIAILAGAEFEVWDFTNVPVDVCVDRDRARDRTVGEGLIRNLHMKFVHKQPYPLPIPDEPESDSTAPAPYVPKPGTRLAIMVDIDGTVALMGSRSPFDETRVHEDRPNVPVLTAVMAMAQRGAHVIFCSGRTDTCRDATVKWLSRYYGDGGYELHMRKAGDMRKDAIVKMEIFDREIRDNFNVVMVFDDRQQVVDAWRSIGLTVMQVAPGDF